VTRAAWKSPVPAGIGRGARVFRPGRLEVEVADFVVERASLGTGVRVYRWPCGTVAIVTRDGREDLLLDASCALHLLGTYASGSTVADVRADLACAAEAA